MSPASQPEAAQAARRRAARRSPPTIVRVGAIACLSLCQHVAAESGFPGHDGPSSAHAARPPEPSSEESLPTPVDVSVTPILGETAPATSGFTTYLVRLHNRTTNDLSGTLHLAPTRGLYRTSDAADAFSQTPIRLTAGSSLVVELPAVGPLGNAVDALLLGANGKSLGLGRGYSVATDAPHLFAMAPDSRVPASLHESSLPPISSIEPSTLAFGSPVPEQIVGSTAVADPETGKPLLPSRPLDYAPATLVLCRTSDLVALPKRQLIALTTWVLGGGSLALVVTRDVDLSHAAIVRLLGGLATPQPADQALLDGIAIRVDNSPGKPGNPTYDHAMVEPGGVERALVRGFSGGNLRPSPWGASATYGGGEVTLLGFDPDQQPFSSSRWSELKLLDLLGHAWDRRRTAPTAPGSSAPRDHRTYSIRRFLLRNDGQHWAISGAALLLIGYAVVAGPVNFSAARRKRRPLLALPRLLALSAGALISVLAVGAVSRGTGRKARHLSLLDLAAGMPRGALTKFRAFHGESYEGLSLYPESQDSVLAVINDDDGLRSRRVSTQDGMHLEGLVAKPWQTLQVKEEGIVTAGAGVSLVLDEHHQLWIVNRLGSDLASIVVKDSDGSLMFFARIEDGARQAFDTGRSLVPPSTWSLGAPLLFQPAEDWMDQVAPGVAQAWNAFDNLRAGEAQWWPQGVPALIGQMVGGRGHVHDSGYEVDSDRALIRVVGFGGTL